MMKWILTVFTGAFSVMFWLITVTVPMTEALVPCILSLFFTFLTWFWWPGRRDQNNIKNTPDSNQ